MNEPFVVAHLCYTNVAPITRRQVEFGTTQQGISPRSKRYEVAWLPSATESVADRPDYLSVKLGSDVEPVTRHGIAIRVCGLYATDWRLAVFGNVNNADSKAIARRSKLGGAVYGNEVREVGDTNEHLRPATLTVEAERVRTRYLDLDDLAL